MHNKCNALESSRNHVCGKIVFQETGPWCQKSWGPLSINILTSIADIQTGFSLANIINNL